MDVPLSLNAKMLLDIATNVSEVRHFGYYRYWIKRTFFVRLSGSVVTRFLPHKATTAEPLHRLLDKKVPWLWENPEQIAFDGVKQLLASNQALAHFDEKKPIILACDASPYGIGAVLS